MNSLKRSVPVRQLEEEDASPSAASMQGRTRLSTLAAIDALRDAATRTGLDSTRAHNGERSGSSREQLL